jgi:DNA-binding XRE family transcriptional regulator
MTVLSTRIKAARKSIHPNVTQRDVAKRFKLSPSAVCLWESGQTEPGAKMLADLAQWFGVSTDWLLGVDAKTPTSRNAPKPPVFTVPVVPPSALSRWKLDTVMALLQTAVLYPLGTAAAMVVESVSLGSACPRGSYAVVSKAHDLVPGCVALVVTGRASEPVMRRYMQDGRERLLVADDNRFPTYRLDDGVRVIGRVVEVTTRTTLI